MAALYQAESTRATAASLFDRVYPLEDIRILSRAQGAEYADGRTVEAYAAVFDQPAEIQDFEGHYLETIDRSAFNKAVNDAQPQGGRTAWRVGVFYNHGMNLHGGPSDRFSIPLGSPVAIRVEDRGLLTVTRYNATQLADDILEAIRSGDITGQSFTGRIVRSDPARSPAGGYRRGRGGKLATVKRLELGLREYGPTPFPSYVGAGVVGVRSLLAGLGLPAFLPATLTEEAIEEETESGVEPDQSAPVATEEEPTADGTPPDDGAAADEPPSPEEEHLSRHAQFKTRIHALKSARPGLLPEPVSTRAAEALAIRSGKQPGDR